MASIIRQTVIGVAPETAWTALRDFGALHDLAPGFVADTKSEDDRTRVVTFHNGASVREALIGIDDESRRIAWTITNLLGATHHSGAAHVVPEGRDGGRCRFTWYTDVLPDALADRLAPLMEQGINAIKRELESRE